MDPAASATAAAVLSKARMQLAVAARMAKMGAHSEQEVAALIEAADGNARQAAKSVLDAGLGARVDISV